MPRPFAAPSLPFSARLRAAVPGLALTAMGAGMAMVAAGQPAWFGADVGPGLMARLVATGVIVLGALWALWSALMGPARAEAGCATGDGADAQRFSAPALLGAVLIFALVVPWLGMVAAVALAAVPAALGAGEREPRALALTVGLLVALTIAVGLTVLPPTAPLWPEL